MSEHKLGSHDNCIPSASLHVSLCSIGGEDGGGTKLSEKGGGTFGKGGEEGGGEKGGGEKGRGEKGGGGGHMLQVLGQLLII